jgi:hypothetical protein
VALRLLHALKSGRKLADALSPNFSLKYMSKKEFLPESEVS